jgi:hypothetical protein
VLKLVKLAEEPLPSELPLIFHSHSAVPAPVPILSSTVYQVSEVRADADVSITPALSYNTKLPLEFNLIWHLVEKAADSASKTISSFALGLVAYRKSNLT